MFLVAIGEYGKCDVPVVSGVAPAPALGFDGAAVAVTYNASPEKAHAVVREIEAGGGKALAIKADGADAAAVKAAVAEAVEHFGRLDVLVNNAGSLLRGSVDDFSLEDFDKIIAVNVRAIFAAVQADGPSAAMLRSMIPLKRYGTADEVAGFVAYLASRESGFVTGASLTIDGGLTI